MEYSIQALSRLSGVTTRTLRWYDSIGLLKPSRVADSGYRYYGPAEVDRLQDILYYRALGVELARIRECLDDPAFDRLTVLRSHLTKLSAERQRLDGIIQSLTETIAAEERNESMNDDAKFAAFKRRTVEENEQTYGQEARARYGDGAVDSANQAVLNLSPEEAREWKELEEEILRRLEAAVQSGVSPDSGEGREIVRLHRRWLTLSTGSYTPERHKGIAELYVMDERFAAYYDRTVTGCARFLRDAVARWAE